MSARAWKIMPLVVIGVLFWPIELNAQDKDISGDDSIEQSESGICLENLKIEYPDIHENLLMGWCHDGIIPPGIILANPDIVQQLMRYQFDDYDALMKHR